LLLLGIHNRLATRDRIKKWNTWLQVDCVLRNNTEETRDYVFFNCPYSSAIWKNLAQRLITINYLTDWNQLIAVLHSTSIPTLILLLLRYDFQCTLYHIWRERSVQRHGEHPSPKARLIKLIDKTVRHRISSLKTSKNLHYEEGLRL